MVLELSLSKPCDPGRCRAQTWKKQNVQRASLCSHEDTSEANGQTPFIKFCDANGKVVYTYDAAKQLDDAQGGVLSATLDPNYAAEITIWDADATKPPWLLAGVDEDNWWNDFVPDDVQVTCSGSKVSGSDAGYYFDVVKTRISKSTDLVFVGSGVVEVPSWLSKEQGSRSVPIVESPEFPYGDIGLVAESAANNGIKVIFEIPENGKLLVSESLNSASGYGT